MSRGDAWVEHNVKRRRAGGSAGRCRSTQCGGDARRSRATAARVFVSFLVIGCCVTGAPAASAARWVVQRVPNLIGTTHSKLSGVSCPSRRRCFAVGSFSRATGPAFTASTHRRSPLLVRSDGSAWLIGPNPKPAGLGDSGFRAISCSSTRACTAVGFDRSGALIERLTRQRWFVQHAARSRHSVLNAVSCPSSRFCEAVGSTRGNGPLAEWWNGSRWAMQPTPRFSYGVFNSVSCRSSSDCVAVGTSMDGNLTGYWNGTNWSVASEGGQGATKWMGSRARRGTRALPWVSRQVAQGIFPSPWSGTA